MTLPLQQATIERDFWFEMLNGAPSAQLALAYHAALVRASVVMREAKEAIEEIPLDCPAPVSYQLPVTIMPKFYRKDIPANPVVLSDKRKFRFPSYPDGYGYFATEDAFLIKEFEAQIASKKGGVVEITEEQYKAAELKKKNGPSLSKASSSPRNSNPFKLCKGPNRPNLARNAGAGAADPSREVQGSNPDAYPAPMKGAIMAGFKPKTGKLV